MPVSFALIISLLLGFLGVAYALDLLTRGL